MSTCKNDKNGFTLIELMVAIVISSIILAGIYAAYQSQIRSYMTQKAMAEMQQNIRNAMYYLKDSIRMAGYDSQSTGLVGMVLNFEAPYDTLGVTTDANAIAFTLDANDNGVLDANHSELIAFRIDNANRTLEKLFIDSVTAAASWEIIAENIDAIDFVYLDGADPPNILAPPFSANDLDEIRSVQITTVARNSESHLPLVAKTKDNKTYMNQQGNTILSPGIDGFHRGYLTLHVKCRNLGL